MPLDPGAVARCHHRDVVYFGDTGRYPYGPKSLDEVSVLFDGPVPTDPFSGTLLRYARVANGVRIEADAPIRHESLREDFEIAWIVR